MSSVRAIPGFIAIFWLQIVGMTVATSAENPWSEKAIFAPIPEVTGQLTGEQLQQLAEDGRRLFTAKFTTPDGAGRPMASHAIIPTKLKRRPKNLYDRIAGSDANSCASCHNEPVVGGAGNFTTNVFVSEGFNNQGAGSTDPQFSNERNTNHLMGSGLLELLAREMTADLQKLRKTALARARSTKTSESIQLITKGVSFGKLTATAEGFVELSRLEGIDADLVIRPFSQKGVMTSLRQFTINALNQHTGMQAVERFGVRWTGTNDFDEDGIVDELGAGDLSALVAFQATLPPPTIMWPEQKIWQVAAASGSNLFDNIGCASCHRRSLPLNSLKFIDPGPYDAAGTLRSNEVDNPATYDLALMQWAKTLPKNASGQILVPLFGDLKRHVIADSEVAALGNELLSQRFVERAVFMTSELWGIASTAPYGHRGDMTTLSEVIAAHGGEARKSRDKYLALDAGERDNIIAFLKTMVIAE